MLTWFPIVCLFSIFVATIICIRCSGNTQRTLEKCKEECIDTKYYANKCSKVFRERKDKLEDRGWTNLDIEEITRIELKVLQVINDNDGDTPALKLAVVEVLSEELKGL